MGRFIGEDSIGFDAGDANLSRYVFNSPLNYVDPSGNVVESGWDLLSLTVGVASFTHNVARGDVKGAVIDGFGIAADTAALVLPGVPGGVGAARNTGRVSKIINGINNSKWIKRGTDAFNRSRKVRNIVRGAQGANLLANGYQTWDSGSQAYQKWQCTGEIPWGDVAQTVFGGVGVVGSARSFNRALKASPSTTLDLFGGRTSQVPGATNFDIIAEQGIQGNILTEGLSSIPSNSMNRVTTFNPFIPGGSKKNMLEFLPEAARVTKPGGEIIISGTSNNRFAQIERVSSEILSELNLSVIEKNIPLPEEFSDFQFFTTNGDLISNNRIVTTILRKGE